MFSGSAGISSRWIVSTAAGAEITGKEGFPASLLTGAAAFSVSRCIVFPCLPLECVPAGWAAFRGSRRTVLPMISAPSELLTERPDS